MSALAAICRDLSCVITYKLQGTGGALFASVLEQDGESVGQ